MIITDKISYSDFFSFVFDSDSQITVLDPLGQGPHHRLIVYLGPNLYTTASAIISEFRLATLAYPRRIKEQLIIMCTFRTFCAIDLTPFSSLPAHLPEKGESQRSENCPFASSFNLLLLVSVYSITIEISSHYINP